VLAASHKFSAPKATSSDPCKHCGKFIHTSYNCFSKHPEKLAEYRARRAARASRGSGIGPSSKGSVSVAAASPAIAPSLSWVLDSGASFHVTSDKSQLAFSTPVIDGTSVQIADGTQLRARKRSEMAKRTAKGKRTRPKALERREESAGNSRPKGSEEAARHGEGTYGEVAPRAPSTRQRRP